MNFFQKKEFIFIIIIFHSYYKFRTFFTITNCLFLKNKYTTINFILLAAKNVSSKLKNSKLKKNIYFPKYNRLKIAWGQFDPVYTRCLWPEVCARRVKN